MAGFLLEWRQTLKVQSRQANLTQLSTQIKQGGKVNNNFQPKPRAQKLSY